MSLLQSFARAWLKNRTDLRKTRLQEHGRASTLFFYFMSRFQVFRNTGNSHSRAGNTLCFRSQAIQCSSGSGKPGLEQGVVELASSRFPTGSGTFKDAFKISPGQRRAQLLHQQRPTRPSRPARHHRLRSGHTLIRSPVTQRYLRARLRPGTTLPALLPGRRGPRGRWRGLLGRLGRLQRRPLQLLQLLQRHRLERQDLGLAQHHGGRVLHRQLPCKGRKGP